ncbi:NAD(P)H-dependent flavin oxidoreductase [Exiguobacterium flavidum]|uniref:NAD(P)H-dependent flavin oxidoreductase n=1 Tax=Exiguobacterium flavidum TaxID=2184695 RepID=UPI000DF79EAD|nr:nitronate monooxygenase [Exiguobacterium flavidum]
MKDICQRLGIRLPIIQGGMGNISNAPLTAAVSNAGGLGTIGCGTMTPGEVDRLITETRRLTDQPFALNIALTVSPYTEELIELAISREIPVVSLSAGNPAPYVERLHAAACQVIALVASVKHALKAEAAGVDYLVAEGFEAAGINSNLELTTFTLIPQITDRVSIPVFAAGGIGDGRGLAAAFLLGAAGVQLGTRLIATAEADVHINYKQHLLQSDDGGTRIIGRSVGRVRRVLDGPYVEQVIEAEKDGMTVERFNERTAEAFHVKGAIEGDETKGYVNAGLVSGMIADVPTVEELFGRMMEEAKESVTRVEKSLKNQSNRSN